MPPNNSQPQKEDASKNKINSDGGVAPIRTYKSDIDALLRYGQTSAASIIVAETAKKTAQPLPTESEEKSWKAGRFIAIIFSVILFTGGAGAIAYFLFHNEPESQITPVTNAKVIISANSAREIPAENLNLLNFVQLINSSAQSASFRIGEIEELRFTKVRKAGLFASDDEAPQTRTPVTASEFLEIIDATAPAFFLRSLADEFFIGLHAYTGGTKPFLIFKINSFENAYAGMLRWEKTISDDLGRIFSAGLTMRESEIPAATTTPGKSAVSNEFGTSTPTIGTDEWLWIDKIIYNKDVRTFENQAGETRFFYSFTDQNTLVITQNEAAFREILARLKTAALVR